MGIKNFTKIISKYAPDAITHSTIDDLTNKTLAIDANHMIYKSVSALRNSPITHVVKLTRIDVTHIHLLLTKIIGFFKYRIRPIFVFDGQPPEIKHEHLSNRKSLEYAPTQQQYQECKQLIALLGCEYINSPQEADAQCVRLESNGVVDGIISDDTDILLFGGKTLIKNFSIKKNKHFQIIRTDNLLESTQLTLDQLIDLGILLGSDYYPHIKLGPVSSYRHIQRYNTIENIPNISVDIKLLKQVRYYFKNPITIPYTSHQRPVNFSGLIRFLSDYGFDGQYIQRAVDKIKMYN